MEVSFSQLNVLKIITSDEKMKQLYLTDATFHTAIDRIQYGNIGIEQLLEMIFMICDGRKNIENELVEYITRYGSLMDGKVVK